MSESVSVLASTAFASGPRFSVKFGKFAVDGGFCDLHFLPSFRFLALP